MHPDDPALDIAADWGRRSLGALLRAARADPGGVAFSGLRAGATRSVLVVCAVRPDVIEYLAATTELPEPDTEGEWDRVALVDELARASASGQGIRALGGANRASRLSAVALTAAEPDSIRSLEKFFALPP